MRRPRRGGRVFLRAHVRRHRVSLPVTRRYPHQVPPRRARRGDHGHRRGSRRPTALRRIRRRRRRIVSGLKGVPIRPAQTWRRRREACCIGRARGAREGGRGGLPESGLAAPHRAPGAQCRRALNGQEAKEQGDGRAAEGSLPRLPKARTQGPAAVPGRNG